MSAMLPFEASEGLVPVTQLEHVSVNGVIYPPQLYYSYDFGLREGANVLAIADGTVVSAVNNVPNGTELAPVGSGGDAINYPQVGPGGLGNQISVYHESLGLYVTYAHLGKGSVPFTQSEIDNGTATVSQGQVIGEVGLTGVGTGPHLHITYGSSLIGWGNSTSNVYPTTTIANGSVASNPQTFRLQFVEADGGNLGLSGYISQNVQQVENLSSIFAPSIALSALDPEIGISITGGDESDRFGWSVSHAGDFNGDQIDDIVISAPRVDREFPISPVVGESYVIYGRAEGFKEDFAISDLSDGEGFRIQGVTRGGNAGSSISGVGDVNGDGIDDIAVVASGLSVNAGFLSTTSTSTEARQVYVVFGSRESFGEEFDLLTLNGENGFKIDFFATPIDVSGAGDVNGDGIDDLIIGTNSATYVVLGNLGRFESSIPQIDFDAAQDSFFAFPGEAISVSAAGDFNGDGLADIVIGSPRADLFVTEGGVTAARLGLVSVIFGVKDGFDADFQLGELNGANGFEIIDFDNRFIGTSVSSAGDFNGDGLDDIVFGVPQSNVDGRVQAGVSYVVFGQRDGLPRRLNVTELDGSDGFKIVGAGTGDLSGSAVSYAGDVNGDGVDDIIVGAPESSRAAQDVENGQAYVIFGQRDWSQQEFQLSAINGLNGFEITAGEAPNVGVVKDRTGSAVSFAGDLNGDGVDDVVVGAPLAAVDNMPQVGRSYVIFGRGATTSDSNDAPNVIANEEQLFGSLAPVPLQSLFNLSDPDGLDDIVEVRFSDDNPGTDEGEFGQIVVSAMAGTFGTLFTPQERVDGDPFRLSLTPDQLDDQVGPFGEYVWNYRPTQEGSNPILIEAVDSVGNVSDPVTVNLTFTDGAAGTDGFPQVVDPGLINVRETTTGEIYDIVADDDNDAEGEGNGLVFTREPSPDQINLDVDLYTGKITFVREADGSIREDDNQDGLYEITVGITDSDNQITQLELKIQVTDQKVEPVVLEYFAKEVAYGRDAIRLNVFGAQPDVRAPQELLGWEPQFVFENSNGTFRAETFTKENYVPLLVFRGTLASGDVDTVIADWTENFQSSGVGLVEFNRAVNLPGVSADDGSSAPSLGEWLFSQELPIAITGHSQGGAQAQIAAYATRSQGSEVAQVATFNSAGTPLGTEEIAARLPALFSETDVTHHINVSDVVSLTGTMFLPSGNGNSIILHDTDVSDLTVFEKFGVEPTVPFLPDAHAGYFLSPELAEALSPDVRVRDVPSPPTHKQFVAETYSPSANQFGQDSEYGRFLDKLKFWGVTVGQYIDYVTFLYQIDTIELVSNARPTPLLTLDIDDFDFSKFVSKELVPALTTRGRLDEELKGENGALIREFLAAAALSFEDLDRGASLFIRGEGFGFVPVLFGVVSASEEDELHAMVPDEQVLLAGRTEDLFGDQATDFGEEDVLVLTDTTVTEDMFSWRLGSAVLEFDLDLDGVIDGEITLQGDYFEGAEFDLEIIGADTYITVDLADTPATENDYVIQVGDDGDNTLTGTDEQQDGLFGNGGNDNIDGKAEDDYLDGGADDDRINGREGNDVIVDGPGSDRVDGGPDDDVLLFTGGTQDRADGGSGADVFKLSDAFLENGQADRVKVLNFDVTEDTIDIGQGAIADVRELNKEVQITLEGDGDVLVVRGTNDFDAINFVSINTPVSPLTDDDPLDDDPLDDDPVIDDPLDDDPMPDPAGVTLSTAIDGANLRGTDDADVFLFNSAGAASALGKGGADTFVLTADFLTNGSADKAKLRDFEVGSDVVDLSGYAINDIKELNKRVQVFVGPDNDLLEFVGLTSFDPDSFVL